MQYQEKPLGGPRQQICNIYLKCVQSDEILGASNLPQNCSKWTSYKRLHKKLSIPWIQTKAHCTHCNVGFQHAYYKRTRRQHRHANRDCCPYTVEFRTLRICWHRQLWSKPQRDSI